MCVKKLEKGILFSDVFEDHVDIDIEAPKSTNEFLVSLHYHPYLRPYAPVNELWTQKREKKSFHFLSVFS